MKVTKNTIDSEILGGAVLELADFDPNPSFTDFEQEYIERDHPIYVTCKVPSENIGNVHKLEDQRFRFVEFQMRLRGALHKTYDTSAYNYSYSRVTTPQDLEAVLNLAGSIFEHDRVSRDPFFQKWTGRNVSGERYQRYVLKSAASADECVYKLVSNETGKIVAFSTHKMLTPETALLLIGGVENEQKTSGLGVINDHFGLNELKRKGVKWFHTHVSGSNYPILNLEVKGLGFRVVQSFVVLRKVY